MMSDIFTRVVAGIMWFFALGFVIAAALIYAPDTDSIFRAASSLICALSIFLLGLVLRLLQRQKKMNEYDAAMIQLLWIALLLGNGFGSLGLYTSYFYYDLILHFFIPLFGVEMIYIFLHGVMRRSQPLRRDVLISAGAIISCILIWELYEWGIDQLIGTSMSGQPGEPLDTLTDIISGFAGVAIAVALQYRNRLHLFPERKKSS